MMAMMKMVQQEIPLPKMVGGWWLGKTEIRVEFERSLPFYINHNNLLITYKSLNNER